MVFCSTYQRSGRELEYSEVEDTRAVITGDVDRLSQAFSNIIWNAVKHADCQGGEDCA